MTLEIQSPNTLKFWTDLSADYGWTGSQYLCFNSNTFKSIWKEAQYSEQKQQIIELAKEYVDAKLLDIVVCPKLIYPSEQVLFSSKFNLFQDMFIRRQFITYCINKFRN